MASLDGVDDARVEGRGRVLLKGIDVDCRRRAAWRSRASGEQRRVGAAADGVGRARACRW